MSTQVIDVYWFFALPDRKTCCSEKCLNRLPRLGSSVRIASPAPSNLTEKPRNSAAFVFFGRLKSQLAAGAERLGLPSGRQFSESTEREIAASLGCTTARTIRVPSYGAYAQYYPMLLCSDSLLIPRISIFAAAAKVLID